MWQAWKETILAMQSILKKNLVELNNTAEDLRKGPIKLRYFATVTKYRKMMIEGDINNGDLVILHEEISALVRESEQQIILDGSSVSFVTPNAVELFNDMLSNDIYLLNFPINFRNMLEGLGWSVRILE